MAFKFIVLAALVAVARGGVVGAPVAVAARISDDTFDPNPQYSFAYDVHDGLTGDIKSHSESRSGDIVQGQYSLVDPDGTRRVVDYASDPVNGYNAIVRKEPLVLAAPAKLVAEPVIAAKAVAEPVVAARAVARAVAAPLVARTVAAPLVARNVVAKQVAAPVVSRAAPVPVATASAQFIRAPLVRSAPLVAAPAPVVAAPAVARLASPYVAAPAPLAYSAFPGFAANPFAAPLTYAYV